MIYLGADHRGYELKQELEDYLHKRGYEIKNLGANSSEPVDYPLVAKSVGIEVIKDPNNRGIVLCGSGAGVCIAANKIKGVRAGVAWNTDLAQVMRHDDDVNILCLSADEISAGEAKKIVQTFLDTSFYGEERYNRRIRQIEELEKGDY